MKDIHVYMVEVERDREIRQETDGEVARPSGATQVKQSYRILQKSLEIIRNLAR